MRGIGNGIWIVGSPWIDCGLATSSLTLDPWGLATTSGCFGIDRQISTVPNCFASHTSLLNPAADPWCIKKAGREADVKFHIRFSILDGTHSIAVPVQSISYQKKSNNYN